MKDSDMAGRTIKSLKEQLQRIMEFDPIPGQYTSRAGTADVPKKVQLYREFDNPVAFVLSVGVVQMQKRDHRIICRCMFHLPSSPHIDLKTTGKHRLHQELDISTCSTLPNCKWTFLDSQVNAMAFMLQRSTGGIPVSGMHYAALTNDNRILTRGTLIYSIFL